MPNPTTGSPTTPAGVTVEVSALTKTFPLGETRLTAVDAVSLTVTAGSLIALTGPSGSGKSTLLHLIGAIDRPDSGSILIDRVDVTRLSGRRLASHRRGVGFVFQRYNLLPALTAADNVAAPVLPYRVPFDKHARAAELLAAVGLAGRERSLPARLSGGQQQRVAIARSLINTPRLLLADEPTGNLDTHTGGEVIDLIVRLRAERGMTVILATHDPRVAMRCDRLIQLRDGAVIDDLDLTDTHQADQVLQRWQQPPPARS